MDVSRSGTQLSWRATPASRRPCWAPRSFCETWPLRCLPRQGPGRCLAAAASSAASAAPSWAPRPGPSELRRHHKSNALLRRLQTRPLGGTDVGSIQCATWPVKSRARLPWLGSSTYLLVPAIFMAGARSMRCLAFVSVAAKVAQEMSVLWHLDLQYVPA